MLANFGDEGRRTRGRTAKITAVTFNRDMERRRESESATNFLHHHGAIDAKARSEQRSEARVKALRRRRRIQQQNDELRMGAEIEFQVREQQERAMLAKQDNQLAAIVYDMEMKQKAEEYSKRRICAESEELKNLRDLLKRAETTKARATQLAERDLILKQTANREARMDAMMEDERRAAIEKEYEEARKKHDMNLAARAVLQDQMQARVLERQRAYEEFLKEKAIVDEVVRGIEIEDKAKAAYSKRKQEELQHNIQLYLEERRVWREEQKRKAEAELKKIQDYNALQLRRQEELARLKKHATDAQDKMLQKLTREIEAKRKEEEDMKQLLYELYQEENRAKAEEKEKKKREHQVRMRQEMINANEYQKMIKTQRQNEMKREEEEFRKKMMDKFLEDDRIAQMNAARRRREMIEYKQEVERLLEERKRRFEQSMEAELRQRESMQAQEEYRKDVIEAERQRLLTEHAAKLLEFLPKGVLQTSQDLQTVATLRGRQAPIENGGRRTEETRPNNGILPGMSANYQDTRFRDRPDKKISSRGSSSMNPANAPTQYLQQNYGQTNRDQDPRQGRPNSRQRQQNYGYQSGYQPQQNQSEYQQQSGYQQGQPGSSRRNPITGDGDDGGRNSSRLSRRPSAYRRTQERPF